METHPMLFGELMKYLRILQIFFNFIFKAMRICSYFDLYLRYYNYYLPS